MMGILPHNTFELIDATYSQIEELTKLIGSRIAALSALLKNHTGILGNGITMSGMTWEVLRPSAMNL